MRLSSVYVERLPYLEVIKCYDGPDSFFYVDLPYWSCAEYYGKGIFGKDDFTTLATQLAEIKGRLILSMNDTPEICEIFKTFAIESVQTKYTCSNGKSIPAGEVLIKN